jgi:hypothetical protein
MPENPIQTIEKMEVNLSLLKRAIREKEKGRAEKLLRENLQCIESLGDYLKNTPERPNTTTTVEL